MKQNEKEHTHKHTHIKEDSNLVDRDRTMRMNFIYSVHFDKTQAF